MRHSGPARIPDWTLKIATRAAAPMAAPARAKPPAAVAPAPRPSPVATADPGDWESF